MAEKLTELSTEDPAARQAAREEAANNLELVWAPNRDETEKNVPGGTKAQKHEFPTKIARVLILGPVTLAYFLWFLDLAVVSTATPAITSEFNSLVDVGWYA